MKTYQTDRTMEPWPVLSLRRHRFGYGKPLQNSTGMLERRAASKCSWPPCIAPRHARCVGERIESTRLRFEASDGSGQGRGGRASSVPLANRSCCSATEGVQPVQPIIGLATILGVGRIT